MIRISSGSFMMGSADTETDRSVSEGPQHLVKLTRNYYMSKYEVTQGLWEAVMGGANPWPGEESNDLRLLVV